MRLFLLLWIAAFAVGFLLGDANGAIWAFEYMDQMESFE